MGSAGSPGFGRISNSTRSLPVGPGSAGTSPPPNSVLPRVSPAKLFWTHVARPAAPLRRPRPAGGRRVCRHEPAPELGLAEVEPGQIFLDLRRQALGGLAAAGGERGGKLFAAPFARREGGRAARRRPAR